MIANNRNMPYSVFSTALSSVYPWIIVLCGMLFYCFNYFLRISPGVMQADLTQAFHINATEFGFLACLYYWAYTPMQVPAGMIYDKFGARSVLCLAVLIAISGLILFISADSYLIAGAGRFLIGLGCAFSYIGILKLASIWLPANRFATVAGLATAVGMFSGYVTNKYLPHIVDTVGYQEALRAAIMVGLALCTVLFFVVRSRPKNCQSINSNLMHTPVNLKQLFSALKVIAQNRQMWLIGAIGCLLYLPSSVFIDLWGISYLKVVYNLDRVQAAGLNNWTLLGWIISGPIVGWISDKIHLRVLPLTLTGFFAAALLCVVFYVPNLNTDWFPALFFLIGFGLGAHPLCFALGKETNSIQMSGTSVAFTNMLIMLGGMLFQPIAGKLLDLHASGALGADGLPIYTASDYTYALSIVPVGVAIGIFLSLFLKETHCRQLKDVEEDTFQPIRLETQTEAAS